MSESKPKKKKEPEPEKPIRILISDVRTLTGQELVKKLRNEHINKDDPNLILGTTRATSTETPIAPNGVKRIIDASKIELLQKVLLDSDVIIYDINNCNLEEAEFALKTLKTFDYKDPKVFICISSVLTWSATPPKEKKEPEEGQPEGEEQEEEEEEEPEEEADEEGSEAEKEEEKGEDDDEAKKVYISFTEKHLSERKCWPKYEPLRSFETLCLSAGYQKPELRTFVLCSGIVYGHNSPFLFEKLKQSYLQTPYQLTYFSSGKTRIPSIHIQDLCEFAKQVILRRELLQSPGYIFATDRNRQNFQKKIIQGISKGVGSGQIISVPLPFDPFKLSSLHPWLLDLRIRPSKIFDPKEGEDEEEEQEEEEEEQEEGEVDPQPKKKKIEKFTWYCKDGIQKNIGKLNQEFQAYESLRPNRILLLGPPGVGKTYYSTYLSHYYNLPLISIKEIAQEGLKIESDFGEELRNAVQEVRDKLVEEEQERLNSVKEKREKIGLPVVDADYEVNPEKVDARIPDEFLMKLLKMRLGKNDCLNRGYVLDGIPTTFKQAELLFKMIKLTDEGEEPDEENAEKIIDSERIPNSVILLEANDNYLYEKVKRLPEKVVQGTHFNETGMKRRVKKYREIMNNENGAEIITDFFQENQIDLLPLGIENKEKQVFDLAKKFINRNGKFVTYQTFEQEQEIQEIQKVKKNVVDVQQLDKQKQLELDEHEQEIRDLVEEEYKLNQEDLRAEERNILEIQSEPLKFFLQLLFDVENLRQYLADNVADFVTEGILEMCQRKPRDPVDFLAEYLFDKSLHVKFPDPLTYLKIKALEKEEQENQVN